MAVTYGFYNSLNKDRVYNAEQMSSIFNGIITDGVFSTVGDALMPIAGTGMQVIVKTGRAWFNSTWTLNDAQLPLDIETADVSLTRIDAIVLEVNSAIESRVNSIKIVKGTPSANPAKPTMAASETLHQYALGYVTVAANVTSITGENIEVNVGKTGCPFITSVLQQVVIDDLFNQWTVEFETWFANIQAQLSGDVAANLQRQIDVNAANIALKLDKSAKASKEAVYNGVSDDTYITPKSLGSICEKVGDVRFSVRDSIDDSWLLADGSTFDVSVYPALSELVAGDQDKFTGIVARSDRKIATHAGVWEGDLYRTPMQKVGDYYVYIIPSTYKVSNGGYAICKDMGAWVDIILPYQSDEQTIETNEAHVNTVLEVSYIDGKYLIVYSFYPKGNSDTYRQIKFGWTDDLLVLPNSWERINNTVNTNVLDSNYVTAFSCYADEISFSLYKPTIKWGDYYIQGFSHKFSSGSDNSRYSDGIVHSTDLINWTVSKNLLCDYSSRPTSLSAMAIINNRLICVEYYAGSTSHLYFTRYSDYNLTQIGSDSDIQVVRYSDAAFDNTGAYVLVQYNTSYNPKLYYCNASTGDVTEISDDYDGSVMFNETENAVLLLTNTGKIYKLVGTSMTLLGTLTPLTIGNVMCPPEIDMATHFYYSDKLIAYESQNAYLRGSFRNICPDITAPAGTKAFIKAKAIS